MKQKTAEHRAKMERKRAARQARPEFLPKPATSEPPETPPPSPPQRRRSRTAILPFLLLAAGMVG